jgi:hypothetical protein
MLPHDAPLPPVDAVLFSVSVKRFDLRFRKIDNSPHAVILE